jgi:hypothetical protein
MTPSTITATTRETALTDPLQSFQKSPALRKSTSSMGNHRSAAATTATGANQGTRSGNGGATSGSDAYSDGNVEDALEDMLKVTEQLKNSDLLRDQDDSDDDDGAGGYGSGADISWQDDRSGSDSNSESDIAATNDRQRGGMYIASARGRQQSPASPPSTTTTQNGTFGSLQEDLSDFEFLYTNDPSQPRSRSGSSPPSSSSSSSASSSSSTTPSKSHRFPKPSSLKKYFLHE